MVSFPQVYLPISFSIVPYSLGDVVGLSADVLRLRDVLCAKFLNSSEVNLGLNELILFFLFSVSVNRLV